MEPVSPEELISLYFDGVATAEEQQEVVRLLEQSSAARAWLAQLEQMRSSLASLPRHKMPVDCTSHVLQRAEQEMLVGRSLTLRVELPDSESPATVTRRQMWVAFAVAAAALIVVVLPNLLSRLNPLGVALQDANQAVEPQESIVAGDSGLDDLSAIRPMAEGTQPTDTATRPAAPGRAEGDGSEVEKLDSSRLTRKAAPQGKAGAADLGDEVAKEGRFLGNAPPAASSTTPAASISYVYNVSTPEAQKAVLETFEKTLREQQIVLEGIAPENAEQAPPSQSQSLATRGLGGGGAGGFGAATGLPSLQLNLQSEKSLDCVYYLEATQSQLSNTIHTLDNLASPATLDDRARRLTRADDELRLRQEVLAQDSPQRAKAPAGQPQPTPEGYTAGPAGPGYGNRNPLNRSQAVRFSTEFAEPPTFEAGRGVVPPAQEAAPAPAPVPAQRANAKNTAVPAPATPPAEPSAARPTASGTAVRDRWGSTQLRGRTEEEQREPLKRAVIIFRVVPADAKIE